MSRPRRPYCTAALQRLRRRRGGFTLVEALASTVILCIVVLTFGALSSRALSVTRLNRNYEAALLLADKQLTLIDYMGVESFVEMGRSNGMFKGPGQVYYWQIDTESLGIDNLYTVRVTVSWSYLNRPYSVSLDTRINGLGLLIEEETQEQGR